MFLGKCAKNEKWKNEIKHQRNGILIKNNNFYTIHMYESFNDDDDDDGDDNR